MINGFKLLPRLGVRGWLIIALALVAATFAGLWRIEASRLASTTATLETKKADITRLTDALATARTRIEQERAQCATDLAGEIQRGQQEAEKARRAGEAIASLTTACVQARGPAATNRALRDLLGESDR
jgi:hypothetical protein